MTNQCWKERCSRLNGGHMTTTDQLTSLFFINLIRKEFLTEVKSIFFSIFLLFVFLFKLENAYFVMKNIYIPQKSRIERKLENLSMYC